MVFEMKQPTNQRAAIIVRLLLGYQEQHPDSSYRSIDALPSTSKV